LTFQGRAYGPVGVRLKGHNSFEPFDRKPSLKVAVDKIFPNARFFGLKDLTLNNMHSDPSMMHERIAYWVARTAGIPASRASHALLSINGRPPALYVLVETVKHKMLNRWFKMPDGALYEATNVDFTTADTDYVPPRDDIPFFELVGKVDDRTLLYGLAKALAMPNPDDAIAGAAGYINLAQFQTFWAMCALVGQFDSMPYSIPGDDYFVYNNPEDKKIYVIPWGMDETFEASDVDVVGRVYSVMARTCKASPACMAQFADKAWGLLDKMESMNWLLEHARVAQQIAAHTTADQQKSYNDAAVKLGQDDMRFFMADRRVWFTKFLPPRTP
jgi:spore coat protein CotH